MIQAVIDQNKIKKKVQKIIIFTSPKNHERNLQLIKKYPGLVINVTAHFSNLTNGFAHVIEEIEGAAGGNADTVLIPNVEEAVNLKYNLSNRFLGMGSN